MLVDVGPVELAAELRAIRESRGKSGDAVAATLKWSASKISRYERARTSLRPREVERLLDYYEITGPRPELLLGLAEDAAQKGWWEEFADGSTCQRGRRLGRAAPPGPAARLHRAGRVPALLTACPRQQISQGEFRDYPNTLRKQFEYQFFLYSAQLKERS